MIMVCVGCGRRLRIKKNGVVAQENVDANGEAYRVMDFDKYKCPGCGMEILAGHGFPIDRHDKRFKRYQSKVTVEFW